MAKLTLMELTNVSQFFGKSKYAMFLATTEDNKIVECGITYNSLTRKGFDTANLENLIGCQVITKEYIDDRTKELINPEDRLQMIMDGEARLILFNSVNCTIKTSEIYRNQKLELQAATDAKVKREIQKEEDLAKQQVSIERALAKLRSLELKNLMEQTPEKSVVSNDEEEDLQDEETPETAETAQDLEF